MKKFLSLLLIGFLVPQLACGALPLKVDGLKSNGDVAITGSSQTSGSVAIGTSSAADSKAALDVVSTTKGFLPPRMTTAQRDAIASPPAGLTVYNTTTNKLNQYNGTAWGEVAGSGSSGAQYNTLTNYNFEDTTYSTGWTASGGTLAAAAGTNILFGTQSATWDSSSAGQTLSYTAITIGQGYKGNNCEGAIYVQTPSGTATHLLEVYDGTNVLVSGTVVTSTTARQTTVNFPCPSSGTMQLRLKSVAADEPLIAIDDAYLGLARNVGSTQLITEWEAWTPSSSWTGGSITYTGFKRRVGTNQEVKFRIALGGAPTGSGLTLNIPSECVIDTAKVTGNNARVPLGNTIIFDSDTGANIYGTVQAVNTTSVALNVILTGNASTTPIGQVGASTPITFASGDSIDGYFSVPCVGWTAQTTASIDAISKRGSISFASGSSTVTSGSLTTFNVAGFGTNTLEGQALAPTTANDLGIRMTGAPAGVYEVTAVGKFYASSPATTGTRTVCEFRLYDGTNHSAGAYGIATGAGANETNDSIANITGLFTLSSAGTINVVVRGQRVSGNGTCYAEAGAYISIKNVSQNSPAIVFAPEQVIGNYTPTSGFETGIPGGSVKQIYPAQYIQQGKKVFVTGLAYFRNDSASPSITWSIPVTNGSTPVSVTGTMGRMAATGESSSAVSRMTAAVNNSTTVLFSASGISTAASDGFWFYSFNYTLP